MIVKQKNIAAKRNPKKWIWIGATFLLIALTIVVAYYFNVFRHELFLTTLTQPVQPPENKPPEVSGEGFLNARILVPYGTELRNREAKIPITAITVVMIESVVSEMLISMPDNQKGIQLLGVYKDKDSVVYIDFSGEIKRKVNGTAEQEYAFLKALSQSIVTNIQGIKDIRILIDSKEAETITGHVNIYRGLKEAGVF